MVRATALMLVAIGLLAGLAAPAVAAEVTATIDRNRITVGETVTLTLRTDDPQQSLEADFGGLSNDFQIIDQRSETQMSIVGGRQSAEVRLLVTLEPLRTGQLVIPSLSFRGGSRTSPLVVNVEAAPELAPGELPPVFIEVEVEPSEGPHYVHAQLSLKVRIFYQQNLTEAAINPPEPAQASVKLLDEVPYQADRNGQKYRVLERRYAVFPERSGTLTIPPMQLTGRLIERPADRLWQPTVRGRRVRIESDPVELEISPRPAAFSGDSWLPARSISLTQSITDGDSVTVGEPVTRTVILNAVGLDENMLDEPQWPALENARTYPDQPQGFSRDDGQWVLGSREFRYAVVPEAPGELVLPEIRLAWWDTVNDRQQVAILAEQRITVLPSSLGVPTPGPGATATPLAGDDGVPGNDAALWPWQALSGLLAVLWVATLVVLLLRPRAPAAQNPTGPVRAHEDEKHMLRLLKAACQGNDPRGAHLALSRWLRHHGPAASGGSLMGLARSSGDPALAEAIRTLDATAYGGAGGSGAWQGSSFWSAFEAWRRSGKAKTPASGDQAASMDLYAAAR